MPRPLELTGQVFGKLLACSRSHKDATGAWVWLCRCECARYVHVRGATLKAGRTSACPSCAAIERNTTHGATGTDLYSRWRAMINRCENRNHHAWPHYGGRGITVCKEWHQFEAFARDMGTGFSPLLELDRIDVDGNYEPDNCRWLTHAQQQRNKRTNHLVTFYNRAMTVTEWAELLGINRNTLAYRLLRGWTTERALTYRVPATVLLELANA
jgi:hypothetical protein